MLSWLAGALDAVVEGVLDAKLDRSAVEREGDDPNGPVDLQVGKTVFNDVPGRMRTELWLSQLHRHGGKGTAAVRMYGELAASALPAEQVADIQKDCGRTFPGHRRLGTKAGQIAMLRVLKAYAVFDPEIGYTQGMNFLCGLLLTYLDEADAFGALAVIMQERGLRDLYKPGDGMALLQARLWQLGRLAPPDLCSHLESHGVLPVLYASSWLLTCFAADFPLHFAARVMDLIITDSYGVSAMLKVGVHILERSQKILMALDDMERMVNVLRKDVPAWSRNKLQDMLTEALSRGWTSRQLAVLQELNNAETVAEALARVEAVMAGGSAPQSPQTSSPSSNAETRDAGGDQGQTLGSDKNATRHRASSTSLRLGSGLRSGGRGQAGVETVGPRPLPKPPSSRKDRVDWHLWQAGSIRIEAEPQDLKFEDLDPALSSALERFAPSSEWKDSSLDASRQSLGKLPSLLEEPATPLEPSTLSPMDRPPFTPQGAPDHATDVSIKKAHLYVSPAGWDSSTEFTEFASASPHIREKDREGEAKGRDVTSALAGLKVNEGATGSFSGAKGKAYSPVLRMGSMQARGATLTPAGSATKALEADTKPRIATPMTPSARKSHAERLQEEHLEAFTLSGHEQASSNLKRSPFEV